MYLPLNRYDLLDSTICRHAPFIPPTPKIDRYEGSLSRFIPSHRQAHQEWSVVIQASVRNRRCHVEIYPDALPALVHGRQPWASWAGMRSFAEEILAMMIRHHCTGGEATYYSPDWKALRISLWYFSVPRYYICCY